MRSTVQAFCPVHSRNTVPLADSEHGGKQEPRQLEARGTTAAATDLASVLRAAPPGETSGRGSDQDPDWRAQTKHVFVLSNAGTLHSLGVPLSHMAWEPHLEHCRKGLAGWQRG